MTHPAFLLKEPDVGTIAGLRVLSEVVTPGSLDIVATGIFTRPIHAEMLKGRAFGGHIEPYELSFESGRMIRGNFQVGAVEYAGTYAGEDTYQVRLHSRGDLQ